MKTNITDSNNRPTRATSASQQATPPRRPRPAPEHSDEPRPELPTRRRRPAPAPEPNEPDTALQPSRSRPEPSPEAGRPPCPERQEPAPDPIEDIQSTPRRLDPDNNDLPPPSVVRAPARRPVGEANAPMRAVASPQSQEAAPVTTAPVPAGPAGPGYVAVALTNLAATNSEPPFTSYDHHPLADAFPLMPEAELEVLADDIKQNGQQQQAVIHEGKILDGRNRAAACKLAGVPLITVPLPNGINPITYAVGANLHRKRYTPAQLAIVAAKLMPHYAIEAAKRKRLMSGTRSNPDGTQPEVPENLPEPDECGEAREKAANATGASTRYVSDVIKLQREAPDLFKRVESGGMKIPKAVKELESRSSARVDQPKPSERNAFLAVLWDDADAPPSRAPEKSYGLQSYPHLAFFHLHQAGDTKIATAVKNGLTPVALFVVPVEPIQPIMDINGRAFYQPSCRFLSMAVRGTMPDSTVVPNQIVEGGYEGVLKMITAMFPNALKAVSTTGGKCPVGWSPIPRDAKPKADPDHPKGKAAKVPPKRTDISKPPKVATATPPVTPKPEDAPDDRPRVVAGPMPVKKAPPVAAAHLERTHPARRPAPKVEGAKIEYRSVVHPRPVLLLT